MEERDIALLRKAINDCETFESIDTSDARELLHQLEVDSLSS